MIHRRIAMFICAALLLLPAGACDDNTICTSQPMVGTDNIGAFSTQPARFSSDAISTDATRYPYNHVACIVELPNGDLFTVWVGGTAEAAADTVIVASRRQAGETSWSPPVIVAEKADSGEANPTLLLDDRGTLWLFHSELMGAGNLCLSQIVAQTSDDNGETWSASRPAFDSFCVLLKNKPIITRTGRWILPAYEQGIYQSQFWYSDDRGDTWKSGWPLLTIPNNNLQPAVVELGDGSLYSLMRSSSGGFTWERRSTTCGKSWALNQRADLPNPNSGLDLIRLKDGRLLLIFNPSATQRTPLAAAFSTDDGQTWSSPKTIEDGPGDLSYPSVIQARDETIHVVYSHQLKFIQHAEFTPAWLTSDP